MKNKLKGIYLCSYRAFHENYDIAYQDINGERDFGGSCLNFPFVNYNYVICTPPCNYWSRANYRRYDSEYACSTSYLLPAMLELLSSSNVPFIVENVRNSKMFTRYGFFRSDKYFTYLIKRHTYFTNVPLTSSDISYLEDEIDKLYLTQKYNRKDGRIQCLTGSDRQGGDEVHLVVEYWLKVLFERVFNL